MRACTEVEIGQLNTASDIFQNTLGFEYFLPYKVVTTYLFRSKETGKESIEKHFSGCDGVYTIDNICDMPLDQFMIYFEPLAVLARE